MFLGGQYFHCDCKIAWIIEWIQNFDLQVTSRDRDPQYCGQPKSLRPRSFYELGISELVCEEEIPPQTLQEPKLAPSESTSVEETEELNESGQFGQKILTKESSEVPQDLHEMENVPRPVPVQPKTKAPILVGSKLSHERFAC